MESISIADARERFGEIIEQAETGDDVVITRDGKPVVVVKAVPTEAVSRPPIDFEALRALRATMTDHGTSAAELIREMRDSRY